MREYQERKKTGARLGSMALEFADFEVEGNSDFLLRTAALDGADWGPNRPTRATAPETRGYVWNASDRRFSVSSVSSRTVTYSVLVDTVYCTCHAYKKAAYPDKSCVHIRDVAHHFQIVEWLRSPLYLVVPTKERLAFRKFSNGRVDITPEWFEKNKTQWLYSTKRDGVRVLLKKNGDVLTANGLRLLHVERALRAAKKPTPSVDLECELTTSDKTTSARVQQEILHATCSVEYGKHFKLWAFDVFDAPGAFAERAQRAQEEANRCGLEPVEQHQLSTLQDLSGLFTKLQAILTEQQQEGLILQNKTEVYVPGKRSSKSQNLKLKKVPRQYLVAAE